MNVRDLSKDELDELRFNMSWEIQPDNSICPLSEDEITDEMLFRHYEGISFVHDDFWCNQKGE